MEARCPKDWHPALVVVDVQNKFYKATEGLRGSVDRSMSAMNDAIAAFREAGLPILFVSFDGSVPGCMADCEDADGFVDGLDFREGDTVIHKTRMNCFLDSPLEDQLRACGCDSIVLIGLVAHMCVLATYFDSYNRGFDPFMCRGALSATDQRNVEHVEAITQTLCVDDLRNFL